jgi:hypothetical protein
MWQSLPLYELHSPIVDFQLPQKNGLAKMSTATRFELARARPNGFQVHPVNHSGTLSLTMTGTALHYYKSLHLFMAHE